MSTPSPTAFAAPSLSPSLLTSRQSVPALSARRPPTAAPRGLPMRWMRACAAATPPPAPSSAPSDPAAAGGSAVSVQHFDGSTLALTQAPGGARVLVDPWLTGALVFGNAPAFFRAEKPLAAGKSVADFGDFDVIVLSQELPDHCHVPTLAQLPRATPVVCPRKAVPILEGLGYTTVLPLEPGMRTDPFDPAVHPRLEAFAVRAGPGSLTGPPWSDPQLAFCFEFGERGGAGTAPPLRVYMETHGTHVEGFVGELTRAGRLDAVISPVVATTIPALAGYRVVNGIPELMAVCRQARPRAVVPFDNSRTPASGVLSKLTKQTGNLDEFREAVAREPDLDDVRVVEPLVGKPSVIVGLGVAFEAGAAVTS